MVNEMVNEIDPSRPLALVGAYGSPYTIKMRAVLRYRRIPFRFILRGSREDRGIPEVRVAVIPVLAFPGADGTYVGAMVDSTPQIDRLESLYQGRSLTHPDPARRFLDLLVEDYADEWVTKMMYHYRWFGEYTDAIDKAGSLLPLATSLRLDHATLAEAKDAITSRQRGRTPLVGSTEGNRPVIESSYERLLDLLRDRLLEADYLFGGRPARGDFALFGQLSQLVKWDPVSMEVAVQRAPHVYVWIDHTEDLSGRDVADDDWDRGDLPDSVMRLLGEIGRTYTPFMLANERAFAEESAEVVCEIDGQEYRQAPFPYQLKCLRWMRESYERLDGATRAEVDKVLDGTGAERLFTP